MTRCIETYQGSCHSGAVRFEIDTDFPELTTCDCSICLEGFDARGIPVRATDGVGMT